MRPAPAPAGCAAADAAAAAAGDVLRAWTERFGRPLSCTAERAGGRSERRRRNAAGAAPARRRAIRRGTARYGAIRRDTALYGAIRRYRAARCGVSLRSEHSSGGSGGTAALKARYGAAARRHSESTSSSVGLPAVLLRIECTLTRRGWGSVSPRVMSGRVHVVAAARLSKPA
eukprot:gene8808-20672_t